MSKVTADNLTDEQIRCAHNDGLITEAQYLMAIGAVVDVEFNDEDEEIEPTEDDIERARCLASAAINARAKES